MKMNADRKLGRSFTHLMNNQQYNCTFHRVKQEGAELCQAQALLGWPSENELILTVEFNVGNYWRRLIISTKYTYYTNISYTFKIFKTVLGSIKLDLQMLERKFDHFLFQSTSRNCVP